MKHVTFLKIERSSFRISLYDRRLRFVMFNTVMDCVTDFVLVLDYVCVEYNFSLSLC